MRISRKQSTVVNRSPILGADRFVLPNARISEIQSGQPRAGDNDAIRMALKDSVKGFEPNSFWGRKRAADHLQLRTHCGFEKMSPFENQSYFRWNLRRAPPSILNLSQTFVPANARAQISPGRLWLRRQRSCDELVETNIRLVKSKGDAGVQQIGHRGIS
jgi:hypothetical protein